MVAVAPALPAEQLVRQLLTLSDPISQRVLLARCSARLCQQIVPLLRQEAALAIQSTPHHGAHIADLLLYAAKRSGNPRHYIIGLLSKAHAIAAVIDQLEEQRSQLTYESRLDFMATQQAIYQEMVDLCLNLKCARQALAYVERTKSRALQEMFFLEPDLNAHTPLQNELPLARELSRLLQQRNHHYRRARQSHSSSQRSTSFVHPSAPGTERVIGLEKRVTTLWHRLRRNSGYGRETIPYRRRAEHVQPRLDDNTLLVEYYEIHGQLVVFLVSRRAIWTQRLSADLTQTQRTVQLLRMNLRSVPGSTLARLSALTKNAQGLLHQLYCTLLAPFADALAQYTRLIIVPHGLLHMLPFHAFYNGTQYLCQSHAVSYLPCASLLLRDRMKTLSAVETLVAGHSHHRQLPYAVDEAKFVGGLFQTRALCEEEATCAAIQERAADARLLHLATHAEFRADNPLFSGLELADGWLTTVDIHQLRLHASLVTLSACRTGRSVVGGGDELLGLPRAFLEAGCASLVVGQWAVEDRSTARLMEGFYRSLAAGATKDRALQAAQFQCMYVVTNDGDIEDIHPYYWAPFVLIGDAGTF